MRTTELVPMHADGFADYLQATVPAYAQDKVAAGQWSEGDALVLARAEIERLLTQGATTPDNYLFELRSGLM